MARPKLLFVEDEEGFQKLVEQYIKLSKEDYEIVFARSGGEAIETLQKSNSFDLVVTDLKMPGIDGWELADFSRANYNLKVIIISAFGTAENLKRAFENQISDFFVKPYSFKELFQSIKRLVNCNKTSSHKSEKVTTGPGGEKKITYHTVAKLVRDLQPVQQIRLVSELLKNFEPEELEAFQLEIPLLKEAALKRRREKAHVSEDDAERIRQGLLPLKLIANSWIEERWIKSYTVSGEERQHLYYNIKWNEGKRLRSRAIKREDLLDPEVRELVERKLGKPIDPSFFKRR